MLQFLHLRGSIERSSFVRFLQETVVDVWENGKRRPFRIAKPYLDPVVPKNSKDPRYNKSTHDYYFPGQARSQTK